MQLIFHDSALALPKTLAAQKNRDCSSAFFEYVYYFSNVFELYRLWLILVIGTRMCHRLCCVLCI